MWRRFPSGTSGVADDNLGIVGREIFLVCTPVSRLPSRVHVCVYKSSFGLSHGVIRRSSPLVPLKLQNLTAAAFQRQESC